MKLIHITRWWHKKEAKPREIPQDSPVFLPQQALLLQLIAKMCDMGGLDNLIANTAYLQARKSGDVDAKDMQKRRKSINLPKVEECVEIKSSISLEYESICEQQPIGKTFFKDYLATVPEYQLAQEFLDEISAWELSEDSIKNSLLEGTFNIYLKNVSNTYLKFLSTDLSNKCQSASTNDFENLLQSAREETKVFLKGKPS